MASIVVYNKSAPVYSPTTPANPNAASFDIPYAVQVDAPKPIHGAYPPLPLPPSPHVPRGSKGHWKIGLFDCCAAPSHFAMAFFFPCVNGAYAAHYIGWSGLLLALVFFLIYTAEVTFVILSQTNDDLSDVGSFSLSSNFNSTDLVSWNTAASICALLFVAGVVVLRRQVRAFYRIPGSSIHDCCCSLWCSCCVMAQMSAHAQKAKKGKRSGATTTLPAYQEA